MNPMLTEDAKRAYQTLEEAVDALENVQGANIWDYDSPSDWALSDMINMLLQKMDELDK